MREICLKHKKKIPIFPNNSACRDKSDILGKARLKKDRAFRFLPCATRRYDGPDSESLSERFMS
jgi:hypothetical protein